MLSDIDNYLLAQKGRIIHQVWFGVIPNKKSAQKAYSDLKMYRDSWIEKNPTWVRFEWSLDLCKQLLKDFYSEHIELFKKYTYDIQRCDAIRYLILHRYGGWYADMDYYCNRPLDDVHKEFKNDIYLVQTPNKLTGGEHISNSLMYSVPNNPFWKHVLIEMEKNNTCPSYYGKHLVVMLTTGPGILNRIYHTCKHRYRVKSLPAELFHPYGITDDVRNVKNVSPDVYAVHVSKGSWSGADTDIINLLYREMVPISLILFFLIVLIIVK